MNVLITLLLYLISFHEGQTQIVSKESVKNYLDTLTILMSQALKNYGISNLPDVDTKIPYNISKAYGYKLVGNLYFEDGFIMDILNIVISSKENSAIITPDTIVIRCVLKFENLRILRDFRYESDSGDITDRNFGSVIITPTNIQLNIFITKYLENNTVTFQYMSNSADYQLGKKLLKYYPENGLTLRLRKANVRPPVLSGLWELWRPIFSNFLEDIVRKVEYPSLEYEF